jgi:predicted RecA/RadA family phage recombinase
MAQATFWHGNPIMVDYTPGSAVTAGDVVIIGDSAFIAHDDIAANTLGAVASFGGIYAVIAGEAIATGKKVYWADSSNKVVETATGNKLFGMVVPASSAAADGDTVYVLHMPDLSGSTYAAVVAALTDNSGGASSDGTIGAITTGTPADLAAQAAINTQIRDAIKELATKINAILTALKDAGMMATA